jgi:hypothetical protein
MRRIAEHAELERLGAKAAVRRDSSRSNPLLLRSNLPAATGESLVDWRCRHDAWLRGFRTQRAVLGPSAAS